MNQRKLKLKNYIGYALCDTGNALGFSAVSSYLSSFYTDIVRLSGLSATLIMVIARIWDAVNDPIMGFIAQDRKPTKYGKYRHYILFAGIPYAISSVLVFSPQNIDSYALKFIWCIFTYILCGMLYTVVLVPYGSLASVMTRDPIERSKLSISRSIGGGIGSAPCGMLFPMLVFTNNALDSKKLLITMAVISLIMIFFYYIGFCDTCETVPPAEKTEKLNARDTIKELLHNRSFMLVSIIGCLLIASSMYLSSAAVYVFKDYFHKTGFIMTLYTIISYAPMVIMIPFTSVIIKKIGKKEFSIAGLIVSVVSSLIICFYQVTNPMVFIVFSALINLGVGFVTVEIWAFACDVIDVQELRTKRREEATTYAFFTFMRKIGQAVASLVPLLLQLIGYNKDMIGAQSEAVCNGIYRVATIGPAVMLTLMLICFIFYPLSKNKMSALSVELQELREKAEIK